MAPPRPGDVENGDVEKEERRNTLPNNDSDEVGEYGNLVRYISTYRDGRRMSQASSLASIEEAEKKKKWWQKKSKGPGGEGFETPEEWLTTDIRQGLRAQDVDSRRKKTGWNELTTEKENMFLKFLSYFTGPILYGKTIYPFPTVLPRFSMLTLHSYGNRSLPRGRPSRLGGFRCHYRYPHAQRHCRLVPGEAGRRCGRLAER